MAAGTVGLLGQGAARRGLAPSEDRELSQLTWFSLAGDVSPAVRERLVELLARDRRTHVRDPRPDPSSPSPRGAAPVHFEAREETRVGLVCPGCGCPCSVRVPGPARV